ncbi:uncharacterized protein PAC_18920 [Phialocephala subalpina]|uniref:Copper acquisition factor BIM1-like domain-containing protein n=1 Tax=Phialocephala subalpina TaxID=576137 RepID=A0A1L7XVI7_9HELO|nr:uncharacterized protein PAC_18920 [Phialocephala subalpina]
MTLTQQLLNVTGNGTLCLPRVTLPAVISPVDGQNATLQVVTSGMSGSALYNCADITFSSAATILNSSACSNSSNVVAAIVTPNGTTTSAAADASSTTSGAVRGHSRSFSVAKFTAVIGAVVIMRETYKHARYVMGNFPGEEASADMAMILGPVAIASLCKARSRDRGAPLPDT